MGPSIHCTILSEPEGAERLKSESKDPERLSSTDSGNFTEEPSRTSLRECPLRKSIKLMSN
jgi:hypothetical protein